MVVYTQEVREMYNNPYQAYMPMQPMGASQQVIRVNGENGARTLAMPPNSSALVLDETAPLVWLCVTDGAGYKTVTPYSISVYKPETTPTMKEISERLARLEARLGESDIGRDEPHKRTGGQSGERNVRRVPQGGEPGRVSETDVDA